MLWGVRFGNLTGRVVVYLVRRRRRCVISGRLTLCDLWTGPLALTALSIVRKCLRPRIVWVSVHRRCVCLVVGWVD